MKNRPSFLPVEQRLQSLASLLRAWRLRVLGVRLGRECHIDRGARLACSSLGARHGTLALGDFCEIRHYAILETWGGDIRIGRHVFVGPHVVIYGHGGVEIGDETLISMHCRILSSNHTIPPIGTDIRSQPDILMPTRIGRDVWLGAGVTVLGGVSIGDGCIVGAGSVVTRDLPPGIVAFGAPAEIKRRRDGSVACS